ncbi:hypothetical protein AB1L30_05145 [Bremerella sp. JC817]|uniref:hypothetical protein n=1 Tax=Bremerella sp. JC817 TaxID=3231756 RepID=UPI00345921FC
MKTFLWLSLAFGLLPVTAFSLVHLIATVMMRRAIPAELAEEEGSITLVTRSFTAFGESSPPTIVSNQAWPAILVLIGTLCCVVGLLYLIPRQPLRVSHDGYARFEPLIAKLLRSSRDYPSLIISAREGHEALLISRGDSGFELSFSADGQHENLAAVKALFASRGVQPLEETTTHDDQFDIDTTYVSFPLPATAPEIATLCTEVFRDACGVKEDEPMEFALQD